MKPVTELVEVTGEINNHDMKRLIIFFFALIWISSPMFSQIIIDQSDMPIAGDTLRVSMTNVVPSGYAKTGLDTSWNYAALEALSQRVDTFRNATATPSAYQLFFVLMGGANLASPLGGSPIPSLPVSQGFTFYKNSATSFSDLGSAYTIQGVPLPAKYDIPDMQYQFPMTPGLTWSSISSFGITVPNLASYSTQRTRSNVVDGWGTLETPFGSFQTLRVKSTLTIHDSVYIDSLGAGFPVIRNITEYKWLADGKGIPVLQISEEGNLVTATYRDICRMSALPLSVSLGPDTAIFKGTTLTLTAIVTGGTPPYQIGWIPPDTGSTITVTVNDIQTYRVLVMDAMQNIAYDEKVVSIKYPPGMDEYLPAQLNLFPNPASQKVQCSLPEKASVAIVKIISPQGIVVKTQETFPIANEFGIDLSDLPDGIYFVSISISNKHYSSKLQVIR